MLNSKLDQKIVIVVLGILTIGVVSLVQKEYSLTKKEINDLFEARIISECKTEEVFQEKVIYKINKGDEDIVEYQITPAKDSTVFSLLEELALKENFKVESTLYKEMGVFVENINEVKNGTNGKYWQYWVNGKLPMVAADRMKVKGGDRIEWKFEIPQF